MIPDPFPTEFIEGLPSDLVVNPVELRLKLERVYSVWGEMDRARRRLMKQRALTDKLDQVRWQLRSGWNLWEDVPRDFRQTMQEYLRENVGAEDLFREQRRIIFAIEEVHFIMRYMQNTAIPELVSAGHRPAQLLIAALSDYWTECDGRPFENNWRPVGKRPYVAEAVSPALRLVVACFRAVNPVLEVQRISGFMWDFEFETRHVQHLLR